MDKDSPFAKIEHGDIPRQGVDILDTPRDEQIDEELDSKVGPQAELSKLMEKFGKYFTQEEMNYLKQLIEILPNRVRAFDKIEEKQMQRKEIEIQKAILDKILEESGKIDSSQNNPEEQKAA